jgi:hypothetical protein
MVEVEYTKDIKTGDIVGNFRVPAIDLREVKLDRFDRMVIDTPHESAADIFQDLEILARRIQEQNLLKELEEN